MTIDVLNIEGQSTGRSVDLVDGVFAIEPNEHAMYLAVKQYNAHQRQGTHKSKERAEIAASTKNIQKQMGAGTASAGSIKSPVFRGGGRIFGPRPRKYTIKLNKKVKRLARASALAQKLSQGQLKVVEDFSMEAPQTKQLVGIMNTIGKDNGKNILVTGEYDKNIYLSGRNMHKSTVLSADELNTFSILNCHEIILTEGAVEKIASSFNSETK